MARNKNDGNRHLNNRVSNFSLLGIVLFLVCFGLLMIYEASAISALRDFGDKFHYAKDQFKWIIVGLGVMFFFSKFNYHRLFNLSLPLLLLEILLLVAVFIPGIGISSLGASRWLNLKFISIQPSELAKIILVIYLAAWLSNKEHNRFLAFALLLLIFVSLIMLQPDMGTTIIFTLTAILIYFVSGAPLWHILLFISFGFIGVAGLIKIAPYRMSRFLSFLKPNEDPLGISYHINQILIALGSGGLTGVGIGKSRQKFTYLPEATTDSIFAIIGEEFGFIGATILVLTFLFIFIKGYKISVSCHDKFGQLLSFGLTIYLFLQVSINLLGMLSVIPLTGVPLPFISYGGSSLIVSMMTIGILLNINKNH